MLFWEIIEADELQNFDSSGENGSCMGDRNDVAAEGEPGMANGMPAGGRENEADGGMLEELP
jgi:hypothetical protein